MVSFGYVKQNGLMEHNHYDRYNGRVNLTTELAKNLTLTTRLGGVVSKRSEPSTPGGMDSAGFKAFIQVMHFVFPDYGQLNWKDRDLTA